MPRRGRKPYEEGLHQKQSYQTRDNTKLKIINYLGSKGDNGTIKNDIMLNANLPTQQGKHFGGIMNELVELEWIIRVPLSQSYLYKISPIGRDVIKKMKEILENDHPLKDLDTFKGISIPFESKFT